MALGLPDWVPTPARVAGLVWAAGAMAGAGRPPEIALRFHGGVGDDLLCTAAARELKRRGAGRIWLMTRHPDLFRGNPDLVPVPADNRFDRLCTILQIKPRLVDYPERPPAHLIAMICAKAGVTGEIALRPYVHLEPHERAAGRRVSGVQIAIQSSSQGARYPMRNKQWPHERFQAVVDALAGEASFVQLGSITEPALAGTLDLRGRTTLRETASILAASDVFLGLVGGLMHIARAVECPAVIVYGGREDPALSGYAGYENLAWRGACAPCWQRDACDFDRRCLDAISAEQATLAVRRVLARGRIPLPDEFATI